MNKLFAAFMGMVFLIGGFFPAFAEEGEEPLIVTVEELASNPEIYYGKKVRVRGVALFGSGREGLINSIYAIYGNPEMTDPFAYTPLAETPTGPWFGVGLDYSNTTELDLYSLKEKIDRAEIEVVGFFTDRCAELMAADDLSYLSLCHDTFGEGIILGISELNILSEPYQPIFDEKFRDENSLQWAQEDWAQKKLVENRANDLLAVLRDDDLQGFIAGSIKDDKEKLKAEIRLKVGKETPTSIWPSYQQILENPNPEIALFDADDGCAIEYPSGKGWTSCNLETFDPKDLEDGKVFYLESSVYVCFCKNESCTNTWPLLYEDLWASGPGEKDTLPFLCQFFSKREEGPWSWNLPYIPAKED